MFRLFELLAPIPVMVFMAFPLSKVIARNIVQRMIDNERAESECSENEKEESV